MRAAAKLDGIEAGRGLAASAEVLYHTARHRDKIYGMPTLMSAFQFGHAGVDLFFVTSGFIILYVHYRDVGTPRRRSASGDRQYLDPELQAQRC
jgi:exopolysaccharide production protein ExoZ